LNQYRARRPWSDSAALAAALKAGNSGGAGNRCSCPRNHRERADPLLDSPNPESIVTPHIAWQRRKRGTMTSMKWRQYPYFRDGGRRGASG